MTELASILDRKINTVKAFPKPGVNFYDVTPLFADPRAFEIVISSMAYKLSMLSKKPSKILAIESRGFMFGTALAQALNLPLVLVRKPGKLPGTVWREDYSLEYGTSSLELQKGVLDKNDNVVIVDDLIATGGTLEAATRLVKHEGALVLAYSALIGLPKLEYYKLLTEAPVLVEVEYLP